VKHTKEFYKEKYLEIIDYTMEKGIENPYHSLDQFVEDYEYLRESGSKNVMKDIKYYTQYEVSYNTARAMLQKTREFGGPEKFKELKGMTTQEFAAKYIDELRAAQKEAKSMFGDAYAGYIGVMWFGSE
jgi:hypothetical protein